MNNVQIGRGEKKTAVAKAMPNEVLVIHVQDPERTKVLLVNDITESRYAKVIAVGEPRGRYKDAPVAEGDVVLTTTATAGVAVPGLYHENKPVHRLDWRDLMATVESM